MSSKTRFFAAASHDLLQPINAAKLLISSLMDRSEPGETQETVRRLDSSFRSIEDLLRALLDIARLESTDTSLVVTSFPLDDVLHGVVEDLGQLAIEKGLDLRVVRSGLWVRSDQRYLARSVQNFVDNAIRYTEKGRILVGCRRHGDSVTLEVWDTGIGISRSDQTRIFKEFTRVGDSSRNNQGMGLGLSIVERACRLLGHPVSVRSKPGVGSVFSLTLPIVAPNPTDAVAGQSIAAHADQDMDLIILLIENDPGVAYAMTQKLESWGASVLAAQSTQEALDLVQDIGMAPDIILADFHLNGEDTGVQAILSVRDALGMSIPAIMITANHEDHVKDSGLANRFSVLTKPVNLSRLRSLIDWKTRMGSLSA